MPRAQLAARMAAAGAVQLIVLRAPAGFGKTTAMQEHLAGVRGRGMATGWLNLDSADNDLGRFLSNLVAAIVCAIPSAATEPSDGGVLDLMARIAASQTPFTLFLDDFEALQSATALDLVRQVIDSMPRNWQVVIGSRTAPAVGLGRLRALGRVLEIGLDQLRFSEAETQEFLYARRGLDLGEAAVAQLHGATEGWATALWLASLALQDHPRPQDFLKDFSGSDVSIAEYLAEDVLARQSVEVRGFLLRTSILQQLSAPLCDALLDRSDSAAMLDELQRVNLFLIALDRNGQCFRYHSLFADFLRSQLRQLAPDEADALHLKAAQWYAAESRPVPAIEHALQLRDPAEAMRLLGLHAKDLLHAGRFRLLVRWFGRLPAIELHAHPVLGAIHAWALALTHRHAEALVLLRSLEADPAQAAGDSELQAHLLALRPVLLSLMDRSEGIELAIGNHARLDPRHSLPYSLLTNTLATFYAAFNRFDEARALLAQACRSHHRIGSTFSMVFAECVEGNISLRQGRLQDALARFRAATNHMTLEASVRADGNPTAAIQLAEALYEAGQLEQAQRLLTAYLPMARDVGQIDHLIRGHLTLARLAWHRGEGERAFAVLRELEYLGQQDETPRFMHVAELERSRLALLRGDLEGARAYLRRAEDPLLWSARMSLATPAHDVESAEMARLRLQVRGGDADQALARLPSLVEQARQQQCHRLALHLMLLWAEALHRTGQGEAARARMASALAQAGAEGLVQAFADEGPWVAELALNCWRDGHGQGAPHPRATPDFAERLEHACAAVAHRSLAGDGRGGQARATSDLSEELTQREAQVLHHLAQGKSNAAIGQGMFLSASTVRTHLRNISAKLGASNRTEVVVLARRHRLIA